MTWQYIGNKQYLCLSSDSKGTGDPGSILFEINSGTGERKTYQTENGTTWVQINDDSIGVVTLGVGSNVVGKFGIDQTTSGTSNGVVLVGNRDSVIIHRTSITAIDKCTPTTITAVDSATSGSLANVIHGITVAPGNAYGSAGFSTLISATPTLNKSIDITIPQSVGADYYDVFLSTSTTAPLWVGRATEAQRATGCAITAVGTVGAGGSAGKINVRVVGTGIASTAVPFAVNTAYTPTSAVITSISCVGKREAIINVSLVVSDLRSLPTLNIIPWFSDGTNWYAGQLQAVNVLAGTLGQALKQTFVIDVKAATGMKILIDKITGQNASVTINTQLF